MSRFFASATHDAAPAAACGCCAPLSRRSFLGAAAGAAGALGLPATARAQAPAAPATAARERIDTHFHYYPPSLQQGAGQRNPFIAGWSRAKALEELDRNGVRTAMLSMASASLDWFRMETEASRKFVREANDFAADMMREAPGRYGLFAYLSMVDVEGTLKEIEYAFDVLKADGVGISTSYVDKYPGDAKFAPIFEELNRRKAVVYFHPTTAACCTGILPGIGDSWIEVPHDTSRAVLSLLFSGSLRKFRDITFLWSHGGGTIPMLAGRIDWLSATAKNIKEVAPDGLEAEFRRFYYDTANAGYAASMAALLKLAPLSQIVFGTDYPYVTTEATMKALRTAGLSDAQISAIETQNAKQFLPRLRA